MSNRYSFLRALVTAAVLVAATPANAAQGEMGTGVPRFGVYTPAAAGQLLATVWELENASRPMPAGCTSLTLSAGTMGLDGCKIAVATMTVARVTGRSVRFFAHAPRDGGCGVDYVELA